MTQREGEWGFVLGSERLELFELLLELFCGLGEFFLCELCFFGGFLCVCEKLLDVGATKHLKDLERLKRLSEARNIFLFDFGVFFLCFGEGLADIA